MAAQVKAAFMGTHAIPGGKPCSGQEGST